MIKTHPKLGTCEIAEISQGRLEKFQDILKGDTDLPLAVLYGKMVRAAIAAGILIQPALTDEAVSEAKPALIKWLAIQISDEVAEAQRIDPLS